MLCHLKISKSLLLAASLAATSVACVEGDSEGDPECLGGKCDAYGDEWDDEVRLARAPDLNPDPDIIEVEITAQETKVEILPGVSTNMYTYNGLTPGPMIEGKVGDTLIVHFTNNLPEPTTIHWHGLEVPADMDGTMISQGAVPPGGYFRYEFKLLTPATYWYHPHVRTNVQVERGLYGAIVVRDPEPPVALPTLETTLMLDDVLLDESGQIAAEYPEDPAARATVQINGREGNILLVNGRVLPSVNVRSGVPIRLHLINASNARFFKVAIPGHTIYRVGGDGGLAMMTEEIKPMMMGDMDGMDGMDMDMDMDGMGMDGMGGHGGHGGGTSTGLLLTPGERADIVFTPIGEDNSELFLEWHDYARGRHMAFVQDDGTLGMKHAHDDGKRAPVQLMRFNFLSGGDPEAETFVPPMHLRHIERIDIAGAEVLAVKFGHSMPDLNGDVTFFANVPFATLTAEDALQATVGETRIWEVTNMTMGDHNFHAHGFFFQHIETEYIDMDNPDNNRIVPASRLENLDTIRVPGREGAKMRSKTITRLAVRFTDEGREGQVAAYGLEFDDYTQTSGGWFAHCHILEHGARGMMTLFELRYPE